MINFLWQLDIFADVVEFNAVLRLISRLQFVYFEVVVYGHFNVLEFMIFLKMEILAESKEKTKIYLQKEEKEN